MIGLRRRKRWRKHVGGSGPWCSLRQAWTLFQKSVQYQDSIIDPFHSEVEMPVEVGEEPFRPEPFFPEAAARALEVNEVRLTKTIVEGHQPIGDDIHVSTVHPHTVLLVVDFEIEGQHAFGVNE